MSSVIEREVSDRIKVRIETYCADDQLLTTINGFQWSGSPITKDLAVAIIDALSEYISIEDE